MLDFPPVSSVPSSASVRISDDAIFREIDGEAVVLNLATGMYYGLNAVGTRAWQLLAELGSVDAVCARLTAEFDTDDDTVAADLRRLVAELAERRLVEVL